MAGMKIPDVFWNETAPRLSDMALAALLQVTLRQTEDLPAGVFRASPDALGIRFAWAVEQILEELAAAPGITFCSKTNLAVVWSIAEVAHPRSPGEAQAAGRRIGNTHASWAAGLKSAVATALGGSVREKFETGFKSCGPAPRFPSARRRKVADDIEASLVTIKRLERQLRAEFDGIAEIGERPTVADRLAVVRMLGAGLTVDDIMQALHGRAAKCRRSRVWQGHDTAEQFLRLGWLAEKRSRLDEAMRAAPAAHVEDNAIVRGPGGTFVGGRQLADESDAPQVAAPFVDSEAFRAIREWGKNRNDRPEE